MEKDQHSPTTFTLKAPGGVREFHETQEVCENSMIYKRAILLQRKAKRVSFTWKIWKSAHFYRGWLKTSWTFLSCDEINWYARERTRKHSQLHQNKSGPLTAAIASNFWVFIESIQCEQKILFFLFSILHTTLLHHGSVFLCACVYICMMCIGSMSRIVCECLCVTIVCHFVYLKS